jgi:hypothetical protein
VTDDLIIRLTAAIDGLTALAQRVKDAYVIRNPDHERDGEPYWPTPRVEYVFSEYGPGGVQVGLDLIKACSPDAVLRGCAADRKLIARDGPFCDCADADSPPMDPATNWTVPIPHHYDCAAYEAAKVIAERYGLEVDGG